MLAILAILALISWPFKKLYGQTEIINIYEPTAPLLVPVPNPEIVRQLAEQQEAEQIAAQARIAADKAAQRATTPYNVCSCVSYAKWFSGIDVGPIVYAKYHPINSQTPKVKGLIIFGGSKTGHLAVITAINGDLLTIKESNWIRCQTGTRVIPTSDPTILGFYNL